MRYIKLKKKHYKDLTLLLDEAGLIKENQAFPSNIFIGKETEKLFLKTIRAQFKKQYPYIHKRSLDSAVGMHWLSFGPSCALNAAIKPGYAVIKELEENE